MTQSHAHRRARRGLVGHGARNPVCTRWPPGAPVGPRPRGPRRHGARPRVTSAICRRRNFPPSLQVVAELPAALTAARDVLLVVPSHALRTLLRELAPLLRTDMHVAWATKGFEQGSGKLPHEVAREELGAARAVAVLSGPTFAREVGAGLPTAMTIASADPAYASSLARELSSANFRAYTSTDIVGVEIGGAVKNALAVGAGLSDGLGFGANTRVALITRGLEGNDAARRCPRRAARHVHGPGGPGRPGAHLHRRSVAQSPLRTAAGGRPVAPRRRWRKSPRPWRATRPRAPSTKSRRAPRSRCRCAKWSTGCCTSSCPRRMRYGRS